MENMLNSAIMWNIFVQGGECGYWEFEGLLSLQQVTNLATVISPNRYCSLLASLVSLLDSQTFSESVPGQGFRSLWIGHGGQVFCNCAFSVKGQIACQFTLSNVPNGLPYCFLIIWFCQMRWLLCV